MPRPHRHRNQQRRRKPADPILMGEPSPALTKIARMNTEKLTVHIQTMLVEVDRLKTKIDNLSKLTPPDEEKIASLTTQRERLVALIRAARERLEGKLERKKQREESGGDDSRGYQGSRGYRRG